MALNKPSFSPLNGHLCCEDCVVAVQPQSAVIFAMVPPEQNAPKSGAYCASNENKAWSLFLGRSNGAASPKLGVQKIWKLLKSRFLLVLIKERNHDFWLGGIQEINFSADVMWPIKLGDDVCTEWDPAKNRGDARYVLKQSSGCSWDMVHSKNLSQSHAMAFFSHNVFT